MIGGIIRFFSFSFSVYSVLEGGMDLDGTEHHWPPATLSLVRLAIQNSDRP